MKHIKIYGYKIEINAIFTHQMIKQKINFLKNDIYDTYNSIDGYNEWWREVTPKPTSWLERHCGTEIPNNDELSHFIRLGKQAINRNQQKG